MDEEWAGLGCPPPEQKVQIMMDITDGCVQISADQIPNQFPDISEREALERVQERLQWAIENRWRKVT